MCGIAGLWAFGGANEARLRAQVRAMTDAIAYRGPDGDGHWVDPAVGVALGHRRLAIIDLTPTGLQPMTSHDGRFVIVYNGEIYNAAEMLAELNAPMRGTSDTEVLLEAIARFGVDGALQRANGLFAFAAFDRSTRTLHLARDRLGIKPLYWTRQGGAVAFASELKALRAIGEFNFSLDSDALGAFLTHGNVPAPASIYREVRKLAPACRLECTESGVREFTYWNLPAIAAAGQANLDRRSEADVVDDLDALLSDAVSRQMISDVPLGAFLSGGIDSSTVVALMKKAAGAVKTFSIGFEEDGFNEAQHAREVARHIGTEHTELMLTGADALNLVPSLPAIYDEPFADSSQLPTYLVSHLARQHVTVSLSGDGGDEVFGGYVRYQGVDRLWRALRRVPRPLRHAAASAVQMGSADFWDAVAGPVPRRLKPAHVGDKIVKASRLFLADGPLDMYQRLIAQWPEPGRALRNWSGEAPQAADLGGLDTISQLRLMDMRGYLPNDILTKVDRASMAVSLEVRVPLLDHRVVEFSWRLPSQMLVSGGVGKRPLRAVLDRYVPRRLIDRPKMGFGVPIGAWIRGPLREWAEDLLSPSSLGREGLFDVDFIRSKLAEHLSGRRNWQYALWTILQFQAWRQAERSAVSAPRPSAALSA